MYSYHDPSFVDFVLGVGEGARGGVQAWPMGPSCRSQNTEPDTAHEANVFAQRSN